MVKKMPVGRAMYRDSSTGRTSPDYLQKDKGGFRNKNWPRRPLGGVVRRSGSEEREVVGQVKCEISRLFGEYKHPNIRGRKSVWPLFSRGSGSFCRVRTAIWRTSGSRGLSGVSFFPPTTNVMLLTGLALADLAQETLPPRAPLEDGQCSSCAIAS